VLIAIGSAISLAYYLRIVAVMWMPDRRGDSPETDRPHGQPEIIGLAIICSAATIFFGIIPSPIYDLVRGAGESIGLL